MKRIAAIITSMILVMLVIFPISAQTTLTGIVLDGSNGDEPLLGVAIQAKGADVGAITDMDGRFSLALPMGVREVVVSYMGYVTQTVDVQGKSSIQVILREDNMQLDELVVVGYGTMKKRDMTGSLSQLKGDDMRKGGAIDIAHAIQGKIAGVQVQQSDGAPGGGMSILVRGANSFSTSSQPLYIVDGVPFETGGVAGNGVTTSEQSANPLASINPHDIESIEVLKDASATAIYGSRGANGVVLITTRRGAKGKTKVELSANYGIQSITKKLDVLDPYTYATYLNEQATNDRLYMGSTRNNVPYPGTWGYQYYSDGHAIYNTGKYTGRPEDYINPGWHYDEYGNATLLATADWQDEIFQTAASHDYNLSVSGGDSDGWFLFSGNYARQTGIIQNSGYERYGIRANIGRHVTKWLEVGTSTSFTRSTTDFANTLSYNTGVVRSALLFPVTYGPDMDTTQADDLNWLAANPAAYVRTTKDQLEAMNWFSSSYAEITFLPFLKFRQNFGLSYNDSHRGSYYGRHTQEGKSPINGKASHASNRWESVTAESILTFDKDFRSAHHLNAMGAFTAEQGIWSNEAQTFWNFPDDLTEDNNVGRALSTGTPSSDTGMQRLASFLGRVNYTFRERYLLTASVRTDGSSKFTTRNKWATFLSGAFAWRMSEEEFIKRLGVFSNLKLRISYGETGNQGIGAFRTVPFVDAANYSYTNGISSGNAMMPWRGPVDENLRWETTAQENAGIDIGFMDNRLNFTIDVYHKLTRDLLQNVQIPNSTGFSNMLTNSGNVSNDGLEVTADVLAIDNAHWRWNMNANIAFNRNSISGLEGDQYATTLWYGADNVFIQRNGCPIGAIFGYIEDGFYDNEAEVRADPQYRFASESVVRSMVGEIKYRDVNHDNQITDEDRVIIGDTNPWFVYGFSSDISYRDFTLSFLLQGTQGNDIFNGNLQDVTLGNIGNVPTAAYNARWTADNYQNALWPKATAGYTRSYKISDRYVEDASYLRLKNLSLSYNWHRPMQGIENLQFSLTGTNLLTLTRYSWFDPDVNAFGSDSSRRGVDIYSYPLCRTISFGIVSTF